MPVGVPKVPFGLSDQEEDHWVDIYNRLYRERVLFFCQELEEELANQLIGILLFINKEDEEAEEEAKEEDLPLEFKDAFMYINSPGGSAVCGIGLHDAMNYIRASVNTIGAGVAASMAALVLANGEYGTRLALPHARVMLRQPKAGLDGQSLDLEAEFKEVRRIKEEVAILFSEATDQPLNKVYTDLHRDTFLAPIAAQFYGIIDKIAITLDGYYYHYTVENLYDE
uniref:ATP-dependent Clp protease proteolytic subunit n=1 Tax=Prototheca wickerhamii TaxID=3111 RepID=A0A873HVQ7_PROWI|nr:ClpP [Prototheca wickerhamii]QOZ41682.1 ClpP [Prototheca wickerhamii]